MSRVRKLVQRLVNDLFWSKLSKPITIPDWYWRTNEVHQHGGSILGFIILGGTFRRISQLWDNARTLNLENYHLKLLSIISQFRDFIHWMVFVLFFYCVTMNIFYSTFLHSSLLSDISSLISNFFISLCFLISLQLYSLIHSAIFLSFHESIQLSIPPIFQFLIPPLLQYLPSKIPYHYILLFDRIYLHQFFYS